jgi:hypothetical protein
MMQRRGFKDSCMTHLGPMKLVEESTAFPLTIHPAFAGSGVLGMGVDASGMQTIDSRMANAFWFPSDTDDLYLLHHGYYSGHLGEPFNFMPLGFLSWSLAMDDLTITAENLPYLGTLWRRSVDLETASIETQMLLNNQIRLRIKTFIPFGTDKVVMEIGMKGHDPKKQPIGSPRSVTFKAGLSLKLRDGKTIYDSVTYRENCVDVTAKGCGDYHLRYRWFGGDEWRVDGDDTRYGLAANVHAGNDEQVLRCALDLNAWGLPVKWDYAAIWENHCRNWRDYWSRCAKIEVGDVEREFLFANSLYLLRCGHDYRLGGTSSFLVNHQSGWHGCMFWDMQFICDGLIHGGAIELVKDFVQWLARVIRPEGRPFPWMMIGDGTTPVSDDQDLGVVVNLALVTAAIRYDLARPDTEYFKQNVWPVCDRVCRYIVESLFAKEGEYYILGRPCGHDLASMSETLINDTYTAVWAVSVLAKCLLLAADHHCEPDWEKKARDILNHVQFENDGETYLHSRQLRVEDFNYASWLPNLLYPTEADRFLDMERFARTRALASFPELYMQKQGDFQPWGYFWAASSDFRRGDSESAGRLIHDGLEHVYGPGYFCEVGPCQWGAGTLPPYATAHGAYLTAAGEQLLFGSYWTHEIEIFTNLPTDWQGRTIRCERLNSGNGVQMTALYSPDAIDAVLTGRGEYRVRCLIPRSLRLVDWAVAVDGREMTADISEDGEEVTLTLELTGVDTRITVFKKETAQP